ncbi:MAG: protein kinase, partial [Gemmatimonadota bacterium]|nr:protein kinase [Gemmatimonadota bacterium]
MTDRTCSRCGTAVVAGAHFCSRCGHDVSGEQSVLATAKMAPPPPPKRETPVQPPSEILEPLRKATAGDYDIAGELGRGGMATVFLAHDIALDRKVAIKVMTPSLVTGAGMVERFKREARTAASLSHPHIIPIYAVRETDRLLFFVMKFVEGRSLDTVIRHQGPLPIPMVQAIMSQVGGALGYAHRRGIVHRDMKPANIMLDDEGWAVVTDFGIAKVADARGLTMTGVTIGTPSYMSPEQCASKEVTGATDQYSLGIVAYELLTGKVPFDADSLMGIMWKHFNEPPPPVRQGRPDCPEAIAHAIERMLAKDPQARWPTMEEAIVAIGAPPMAPGDPIRKQMRALAHGGSGEVLLDQVHTPASPIPTGFASSPDAPTMRSSAAPVPSGFQAPPTPPPTPAPTGAEPPTVLTDQAATVVTPEGDTVVTAGRASIGSTAAPAGSATPPPMPTPTVAPRPSVDPVGPPPRKRTMPLGLGLVGLTVASAAAVWFVLSLRSPGTAPAEPELTGPPGVPSAPPPAPVARLQLNPEAQSMAVGASGELLAFLVDSMNTPLGNREITWTSSDPSVATARAGLGVSGVVEALKAGTVRIIASSEGKADTATITVTAVRASVASVAIQLQSRELAPGDTVGVVTLVRDESGGNLGGRTVALQSSDPAVLRIVGTRLIALSAGTASIVAASENVRSTPTSVTVAVPPVQSVAIQGPRTGLEPGGSARLGLTVLDARNRVVSDYRASWQSSNSRVATVQDDGTVRAVAEGEATITATVAGQRGQFAFRVRPPARVAVARLQISRQVGTLQAGQTHDVSASALDAANRTLMDRQVTWASSNPAIATVSADGTIEAKSAGTVTITATSEGQTDRFALEVTAPPPVKVADAPVEPETPASPAVAVASVGLGAEFTCVTLSDGSARCWGADNPGATVSAARLQIVVAGVSHACGLTGDGSVLCWGNNRYGQLGNGAAANENAARPVRVATDLRFRRIAAGGFHTCGIATDGSAWCWGRGNDGQLGNNSNRDQAQPVPVARGLTFAVIAAGEKYTCGVAADGKGYCWGDGYADQLGIGIQEQRRQPEEVRVRETLAAIAAGKESACAIGTEGNTYCWGRGNNPFGSTPRRVETEVRFTQLTVGGEFACGLTRAGAAWCWG